jgi:hypothetical protein
MASTELPPRPADSKRKTWVFNPPPGWPAPPAGWQPPADWHPHPTWPREPADWEFWRPAPRRGSRGISFYIKAVAGVLTFAATVTGTYLAYLAVRGQPQTTANWVRQANAACNQDVGPLQLSLYNGLIPFTAGQGGSSGQPPVIGKLRDLITVEGSLSKLVGDLGALQTPQDDRASEVQAVLRGGNALVDNLATFSNDAQAVIEHTSGATSQQIVVELSNAAKRFQTASVVWQKAIGALGLTRCPGWVRNPNVTPTLPGSPLPSSTSSLTHGEQQLVSVLNSNYLTGCTGRPDLEGRGIVAAVNCQSMEPGPTKRPLVEQFSDLGSAHEWFTNNTVGFVDKGNCADGYKLGTWTYNDVTAGMLGCSYTARGGFRMVWVIDSAKIGVIADGSDGSTMYAWWTKFAYVISSAG